VLVPSLQGRWEYLSRTVDVLARSHRVITFSLCDERVWGRPSTNSGLDQFADQVADVLDDRGLSRAVLCGVSFGGRIALRFAAGRPERTSALILVSTPGPGWHLKPAHRVYARNPRLLAPLFFAGAPARFNAELTAALPFWKERLSFSVDQLKTLVTAPLSPSRMAERARLIDGADVAPDCASVSSPTLVITGERELDHVVPADGTSAYTRVIAGARSVTLPRSGHFGCITRPEAFADVIEDFLGAIRAA
jgi:pimeloyl-ACP methyl ester carboxylesterase